MDELENFKDVQDYLNMYRAQRERAKAERQEIIAQLAEPENADIKAHIELILRLLDSNEDNTNG